MRTFCKVLLPLLVLLGAFAQGVCPGREPTAGAPPAVLSQE